MKLREIAIARSGDKGDTVNVVVVPLRPDDWDLVREHVTVEVVRQAFGDLVRGDIVRYELPGIRALNFVLDEALAGGVSASLRLDPHGKSYQSLLLDAELPLLTP